MKLGAQPGSNRLLPLLSIALIGLSVVGYLFFANRSARVRMPIFGPPPPQASGSVYDQLRVGMTYDQVVKVAGQPSSCEYSSAPPPTDYRICYWSDPKFSVSFQNNLVTAKTYPQSSPPPASKPSPPAFNAEQFYNQVRNGMSYAQVASLAGRAGDCGATGVHPSSSLMSCTWQDAKLSVTVSFDNDVVAGKTSRNL